MSERRGRDGGPRDRFEGGGRRDRFEGGGVRRGRTRSERGERDRDRPQRDDWDRERPQRDDWGRERPQRSGRPARRFEGRASQARHEPTRNSTRAGTERYDRAGQEAIRLAAQRRPEGGYSLDDFDDIPVPRSAGANADTAARASGPGSRSGGDDGADAGGADAPNADASTVAARRAQDVDGSMRLQKALANAGVASRRLCEEYIVAGRVTVNGTTVTELGSRVHPERDRIEVDGTPVQLDQSMRYVLLNKPTGVVSTMRDEQGRPDLRQFTRGYPGRIYNVGRLDGDTSGLLILTNDGDLANVLSHPSYGVEKTYVAKVRGRVTPQTLQLLLDGFELEDGFIKADRALIHADQPSHSATLVELTLHSGRNRIVRRMLDHVGHPVLELVRRSFGPLHLGTLRVGETRELTNAEVGKLLRLAKRAERRPEDAPGRGRAESRDGGAAAAGRGDGRGDRRERASGDRRDRGRQDEPRQAGGRARGDRGARPGREDRGGQTRREDRGARPGREDRGGRSDGRPGGGRPGSGRSGGQSGGGQSGGQRGGGQRGGGWPGGGRPGGGRSGGQPGGGQRGGGGRPGGRPGGGGGRTGGPRGGR